MLMAVFYLLHPDRLGWNWFLIQGFSISAGFVLLEPPSFLSHAELRGSNSRLCDGVNCYRVKETQVKNTLCLDISSCSCSRAQQRKEEYFMLIFFSSCLWDVQKTPLISTVDGKGLVLNTTHVQHWVFYSIGFSSPPLQVFSFPALPTACPTRLMFFIEKAFLGLKDF